MLSSVKSFEMLPKHNGFRFIFESFVCFGLIFFVELTNKKLLLPL